MKKQAILGMIVLLSVSLKAQVSVTAPQNGDKVCVGSGFIVLDTLKIIETAKTDIAIGTSKKLVLKAPSGIEFNVSAPTSTRFSGSDLSSLTITLTKDSVALELTVADTQSLDAFFVAGLQVKALSAHSGNLSLGLSSSAQINGISQSTDFGTINSFNPPSKPSITNTKLSFCSYDDKILFASNRSSLNEQYLWYRNNALISGEHDSVLNLTQAGNYRVALKNTVSGCISLQSNQVTVTFYLPVKADAGADKVVCAGSGVVIGSDTATASGGTGFFSLLWSPATGLNNPRSTNPTARPSQTTEYQVTVTDASGCIAIDTVLVSVRDTAEIEFKKTTRTVFGLRSPAYNLETKLLKSVLPASGSYYFQGNGVAQNPRQSNQYCFFPAIAGIGSHKITYYHTLPNGCISKKDTTFEVQSGLVLGLDTLYCSNAADEEIVVNTAKLGSFNFEYLALLKDGIYYSDTSYLRKKIGTTYIFKPSVFFDSVGEGEFSVAVFASRLGPAFSFNDEAAVSHLKPKPAKPQTVLQSAYCQNDASVQIGFSDSGYLLQSASGTGVEKVGTIYRFVPSLVSIPTTDTATEVSVTLNYSFEGCNFSAQYPIIIHKTPAQASINDITYCKGDTIQPIAPSNISAGTKLLWYKADNTLLYEGSIFDPTQFGLGSGQSGKYDFYVVQVSSRDCRGNARNFSITIYDTAVISINGGTAFNACESDDELVFIVENSDTLGISEYFIDNVGVSNLNNITSRQLGVGNHTISMVQTNVNGCKSYTEVRCKVFPEPQVHFKNLPKEVCQNSARFEIEFESDIPISYRNVYTENPSSVVFYDANTDKYYFDPLDTGYQFLTGSAFSREEDGFCIKIFYDTVYVIPEPAVQLEGSNLYCANDAPTEVQWLPQATKGLSGVVSFDVAEGFTDLGNGKVLINPTALYAVMDNGDNLPKTANLIYTYTDSSGCSKVSGTGITILPKPKPIISILGNKKEFCFSDDSILVLGNANLSGTGFFRGRGLTSFGNNQVYFWPSLASEQAGVNAESSDSSEHRIVYVFESAIGACTDSAEITLKVRPMPEAAFSSRSTSFCIDDSAARLFPVFSKSVASAVRFSGRGVITYEDGRSFFFPRIAAQSVADTITDTYPQTPTYHEVTAEFTSTAGKCVDKITKIFTVNPLPLPEIVGLKEQYCIDEAADTLQGIPTETIGTKGRFSGGNITNITGGVGIFNPSLAGIGLHNITYNFEDVNGCTNQITLTTRVIDRPELSITVPKTVFCFEDDSVELVGNSNQLAGSTEGYFTGRGIYNHQPNKAYFYPKRAALEAGLDSSSSLSSSHKIEYEFTNFLDCSYKQEITLMVHPMPDVDFAIEDKSSTDTIEFCISESSKRLIPINNKGLALASVEFSGRGVSSNVLGEFFFNPRSAALEAGASSDSIPQTPTLHPVVLRFVTSNGACSKTFSRVMKVNPLPQISLAGFKPEYCLSEKPDTLKGSPQGTFSSSTANLANLGNGKFLFSPLASGVGSHIIKYSLTNDKGCTSEKEFSIAVNALPQVGFSGFNPQRAYCYFADSALLTGVPTDNRGTFSGNGIRNNGDGTAWFKPSQAAQSLNRAPTDPPSLHRIVWTYTDVKGCIDSVIQMVRVDSLPQMGLTLSNGQALASSYCYSQPQLTLRGIPSPSGGGSGVFTGRGITDNRNGTATFSPRAAQLSLGLGEQDSAAIHTISYTFTDARGCTNSISTDILVNPLPSMSFVEPKSQYCYDQSPDTILSLPAGAKGRYFISGTAPNAPLLPPTLSNGLLELGSGKAVFFPKEAAIRAGSLRPTDPPTNHRIVYRFTNTEGCDSTISRIVTVLPLPQPDIIASKRDYCRDDLVDTLLGRPTVVAGITSGSFSGPGITDLGDGRALFNPRLAQSSSPVIFTFTNTDGCSNSVTRNLNVLPLPVSYFKAPGELDLPQGADWPDSVCYNTPPFRILTDSTSPLRSFSYSISTQRPDGSFQSGQGLSSDGFFLANLAGVGVHRITLNYLHQNGCDSTFSRFLRVSPEPKVDFMVLAQCEADSVLFLDVSTVEGSTRIKNRRWNFGYSFDGIEARKTITGRLDTVGHFFQRGAGEYNVTLTIETTDGCVSSVQKRVKVGATPFVAFEFADQCEGNQTIFNSLSRVDFSDIVSYLWDFEGNGFEAASAQTTHTFSRAGRFNVRHRAVSSEGCYQDTTIEVIIYPNINTYPYVESFENGNTGGWNQYGKINSWRVGEPGSAIINKASEGQSAWVTNPLGNADSLERSFVESPCFDLRSLRRPMISLDIFSQNTPQSDGASLQYSTDNGITWKLLGSDTDLFGWYDRAATPLTAAPGGSLFGWSGRYLNWQTARNYLDILRGQPSVRFRIAYASTSPSRNEGFAFDNIYIGERRKTVLVEQFRNLNENLFDEGLANSTYNIVSKYHNSEDTVFDAVAITYHIETSNLRGDSINLKNIQDPGARAFLYGTQQSGRSIVDGDLNTPYNANSSVLAWNEKLLEFNALKDNDFDLKLDLTTDQDGKLRGKVYIISNTEKAFSDEITLHVAMIEKFITVRKNNQAINLQWTLRKMLPDAGGTVLRKTWKKGEIDSVNFVWQAINVTNPDTVGVIAFLQNTNISNSQYRTVYQTIYKEPKIAPKVITALTKDELGEVVLYPNPASAQAYVMFKGRAASDYTWQLYNLQGQAIKSGTLTQNSNGFVIDLHGVSSGVYLVEVRGTTLKLMVE